MIRKHQVVTFLSSSALLLSACLGGARAQQPSEEKLINRFPFDRITLTAANDNAQIDVQMLDLPARRVPDPLPTSGHLEVRRLSDPTKLYNVSWSDIARIQLYEQLVLGEANVLLAGGNLERTYENLAFLHSNYPELPGLEKTTETYLQQDAVASFQHKDYEESLAILASLYDLNPERAGLAKAVEGISNRLITAFIDEKDFAGARRYLENLRHMFPELALTNKQQWEQEFRQDAAKQLQEARASIKTGDFTAARKAVRRALGIVPDLPEAQKMLDEIDQLSPQTIVGVGSLTGLDRCGAQLVWDKQRIARLLCPSFVELAGIGSEGGDYRSRWADLESDDSGLGMTIRLNRDSLDRGISPEKIALALLDLANPECRDYRGEFAAVFGSVEIHRGQEVLVSWRHPFVRPLALLQFPIAPLVDEQQPIPRYASSPDLDSGQIRFESSDQELTGPKVLIEQRFENEEAALLALSQGDIDILADVPPWQYDQVTQFPQVKVSAYRIPSVHVLQLNYANPLVERREFRRALCYGIDRARIVADVLGGAEGRPGFRVLSGPIPAGIAVGDTIGYAYKQDLQPLPYEPRLAAVLHTTARAALAKLEAMRGSPEEKIKDAELQLPEVKPLVLEHARDPVSRAVTQLIKQQLDVIGIPITLREIDVFSEANSDWDLRLLKLGMSEPVVDVRRLLGPRGLAGRCSPSMNLLLRKLDGTTNWNDARNRLHEVHKIAADDLPVIPLWQTVNYFAYHRTLRSVGRAPVSLYQNVSSWGHDYKQVER